MPNDIDAVSGSLGGSTSPHVAKTRKEGRNAIDRALDFYLNPTPANSSATHAPGNIFVVAADVDNETLLAHACESLASAGAMAGEFAGGLEGVSRKTMMALQQVIMLSELVVSRVLDNVGSARS
jgi:hypothetical protein